VGCRVAGAEETTTGSNVASGELTTVSGFGEVEVEAALVPGSSPPEKLLIINIKVTIAASPRTSRRLQ
jgi:hypothetical protein